MQRRKQTVLPPTRPGPARQIPLLNANFTMHKYVHAYKEYYTPMCIYIYIYICIYVYYDLGANCDVRYATRKQKKPVL